jgi:hypothetical protein
MENTMSKTYEPDRQFVERLEWQLATEYRRMKRQRSSGKVALPRRAVAFALAAGVLLTGVAAIKAAEYVQDTWRKKIEVARAETDVRLQQARLESGREMVSKTEQLAAKGLVRQEEYRILQIGQERAEFGLEGSRLNLEEVKRSGVAPRDELYAPLVGGRDFVSERLGIESKKLALDMELVADRLERLRNLREKRLISGEEPDAVEKEMAVLKCRIDEIDRRLELRKRFIDRKLSALEVEIADRLTAAETNIRSVQLKVDALTEQLKRVQALQAKGMVSSSETAGMHDALDAAQAELRLATLERDVLKRAK